MLTADPIQDMALADVCECPQRVTNVETQLEHNEPASDCIAIKSACDGAFADQACDSRENASPPIFYAGLRPALS